MLLTSQDIQKYISGVIFHEETAKQSNDNGINFVQHVASLGIVPGIKVDKGLGVMNLKGENWTKGLDALPAMAK
jgi:fructose-bisphosphate aldolase class I